MMRGSAASRAAATREPLCTGLLTPATARAAVGAAALACGIAAVEGSAQSAPRVTSTQPSPIVLSKRRQRVRIDVAGLPGKGPIAAVTNVGRVLRVTPRGDGARILYRPPHHRRSPQQLVLLLWRRQRDRGPAARRAPIYPLYVPLLGRTRVPIRTRRYSKVVVRVGDREFGPFKTGRRGKIRVPVVVEPTVTEARVTVTDRKGLTTSKRISIRSRRYPLLAVAVRPRRVTADEVDISIFVASARASSARLELRARKHDVTNIPVEARRRDRRSWTGRWKPDEQPPLGRWKIAAWLRGVRGSARSGRFRIEPARSGSSPPRVASSQPASAPVGGGASGARPARSSARSEVTASRQAAPPESERLLRWNVAVAAGLMHNLGAVFSPRVTLEVGGDYPLWIGRIGARLSVGLAWGSQQVKPQGDALEPAESKVWLVPLAAGLTYRIPFSWVSPYLSAAVVAQLVHTSNEASYAGTRQRLDLVPGGLFLLGADVGLGPGGLFLQAGFQYSHVANDDVELLAGGAVAEAGYRLEL